MSGSQLSRLSGLALVVGAVTFIVHLVARSVITAGVDPVTLYQEAFWVPINALGVMGAALVLLGLPMMYARMAGPSGVRGLVGVVLITFARVFLGVFLSLISLLVAPWLADKAPTLVATSAPLPTGFIVAFVAGVGAELVGTVLLAMPLIQGRVRPRWVGFALPTSALLTVVGDIIAPTGPAPSLVVNLLSNLGPVLLVIALGGLGSRMWLEHAPANQAQPRVYPSTG
jgi:hypothetical protein